ncbi:MAG: ABC transporter substrate-binding protein [Syntrophorhabdales bacterium]|jgi:branched-chain amino acid transport system substrate-binding protein
MRRRTMVSTVYVIAVLVFISLFIFTNSGVAQDVRTLKVGSVLPLNFGMGVDTKKAMEMLADEVNAQGGITVKGQRYNIQLIIYDDKWTAEAGRAAMERLIYQDKVKHIVGTINLGTVVPAINLVEEEKVLHLFAAFTDKLLNPNLRYHFAMSTIMTSTAAVWTAAQKLWPNLKTVVFLAPNDEGGVLRVREEKRVAEAHGVKVLDTLYYPRNTAVDFTPLGIKAMALNPDAVDYPGADTGTQLGLQIKAVHAAGFSGPQISAINLKLDEIRAVTSDESLENFLAKMPDTELPSPPPIAKAFKDMYAKKYGKWSDACLAWLPSWYAFLAAIKKADTIDSTEIADMLATKGLEFQRIDGKSMMIKRPDKKMTKYCDVIAEVQYGQIKSGKLVPSLRLTMDEVRSANEKVYGGGSWK